MIQKKPQAHNAEWTITGFLIGFVIAQLICGPISDRIRHKLPLFIAVVLFVIGSVGCTMSETMQCVVFWHVFQAVAAALLGSLQYGSGIVSSALLALLTDGTPHAMVWIIVGFVGLCWAIVDRKVQVILKRES